MSELCVGKLCVCVSKLCVSKLEEGAAGGGGRRAEVHNQNQESHTMMWGTNGKRPCNQ